MKIILVGCGKMGSAMLDGWIKGNIADEYIVIDPKVNTPPIGIKLFKNISEINSNTQADIVIFAVKPQIAPDIIPNYKKFVSDKTIFISIMAGITIDKIENLLSNRAKIVRAMPNTPAAIGRGITAIYANQNISKNDKDLAKKILLSVGEVVFCHTENMMDAVTALSGSGPAYIFLLVEAMTKAGIKMGLSTEIAEKLARQTVIGSAHLLDIEKSKSAQKLRENVTSPNGTTAAALEILMNSNDGLPKLMERAIKAASKRSQELSK